MEERIETPSALEEFRHYLISEERASATVGKYLRDVRHFACFAGGRALSRQIMLAYAERRCLSGGPVFVTHRGRPVSRTAVWRDMKALCRVARVAPGKVFSHNLRHLFVRTFYGVEKDIAKLADILGHSSIDTTRIYIATNSAEHRRRMEGLHLIWQQKKPASGAGNAYT